MSESPHNVWRIGEWHVSPELGEISRDGRISKLDPRVMRLLMFLAERPGEIVGVDELLEGIWGHSVVTPHSVYEVVAALRHALEDHSDKPTYIVTLPRRGYRLVASVVPGAHRPEHNASASELTSETVAEPEIPPPANAISVRMLRGRSATAITLTIVILASTSALTWVWMAHRDRPATTSPIAEKSIAVLPFVDMSEKHDQEYFAEGMAEDVLDQLVKVPSLRVIARTSSFQFKGKGEDLRLIRTNLGAAFVVEGSVRRLDDNIRVTAQLLSTEDGSHLWSETYERKVVDALQVQSQIAYGIARALELTITDVNAVSPGPPPNVEAYNVYLKGRHAVDRYDRTGYEEAVADFQQALKLDPTFAPAAAWLAWTFNAQAEWRYTPSAQMENARAAAQEALRLDSKSALAHAMLAEIHIRYDWDWAAADREVKVALALEPHDEWALDIASNLEAAFGRWDEAVRYSNEAIAISPLSPGQWWVLGAWRLRSGRLDEAEAATRKALEISPSFAGAHYQLGKIYLLRGQLEAARVEMAREGSVAGLALVYHALGRHADSDRMLERASAESAETGAHAIAVIHAFRGESDAAFDWLERAYRQKDIVLAFLKGDPLLRSLEHDPRYGEFMRKMNLPK